MLVDPDSLNSLSLIGNRISDITPPGGLPGLVEREPGSEPYHEDVTALFRLW